MDFVHKHQPKVKSPSRGVLQERPMRHPQEYLTLFAASRTTSNQCSGLNASHNRTCAEDDSACMPPKRPYNTPRERCWAFWPNIMFPLRRTTSGCLPVGVALCDAMRPEGRPAARRTRCTEPGATTAAEAPEHRAERTPRGESPTNSRGPRSSATADSDGR